MSGSPKLTGSIPLSRTSSAETPRPGQTEQMSQTSLPASDLQVTLGRSPALPVQRSSNQPRSAKVPSTASGSTAVAQAAQEINEVTQRLWKLSGGVPTSPDIAASSQETHIASPLEAACEHLAKIGLVNHVEVSKKQPKTALPAGLGLVHSNLFSEFVRSIDSPAANAPADKKARETKNKAMNAAIRTVDQINTRLDQISIDLEKLAMEMKNATFKDVINNGMNGRLPYMEDYVSSFPEKKLQLDALVAQAKQLSEDLVGQCKRLSSFPDMPRPGDISKRDEFRSKLLYSVGKLNFINAAAAYTTDPCSSSVTRPLIMKMVRQEVLDGGDVAASTKKVVEAHEKSVDHSKLWHDISTLAECLELDDKLPPGTKSKLSKEQRTKLFENIAFFVAHACEAQFKIIGGPPRQRILDVNDLADATVVGEMNKLLNSLIGSQQLLQLSLNQQVDTPVEVFNQEVELLKHVFDRAINDINKSLHLGSQDKNDKELTTRERKTIAKALGKMEQVAQAYEALKPDAKALIGESRAADEDRRLESLLGGLELGRYAAQTMANVARAALGGRVEGIPIERSADGEEPTFKSSYAVSKVREANSSSEGAGKSTVPAIGSSRKTVSLEAAARPTTVNKTYQEIKAELKPLQEMAKGLMTAGKNERARHKALMSKFRCDDLLGAEALDNAVRHFAGACSAYDKALVTLEKAPREKYPLLEEERQTTRAAWSEAHRLMQETKTFRDSPASKRPTESVMAEMEARNMVTLHKPIHVPLPRSGGQMVKMKIGVEGGESLWLRMHLPGNYNVTDMNNIKEEDFIGGPGNEGAISVKTDFYDQLHSNRDHYGEKTPRVPWSRGFAYGVFKRALASSKSS